MCSSNVIKNGKVVIRLAKLAPAPNATKIAGNAQQISVDDEANKEKKFEVLSFIKPLILVNLTYSAH